jgi:hypothetical protein
MVKTICGEPLGVVTEIDASLRHVCNAQNLDYLEGNSDTFINKG